MTIREAREEDHEGIWSVFHEVVVDGGTYPYSPGLTRDEALAVWVGANPAVYVAEDSGEIVGTYYLRPNQPGLGAHVCNAGYMVSEAARGRGVGTALCEHSLREASRLGYRAMQFNLVVATNQGAVRMWRRFGFEVVGTLPGAFRHTRLGYVDAHVMFRSLVPTDESWSSGDS